MKILSTIMTRVLQFSRGLEENNMKNKFAKLIDVKSIVTLLLTFVFCYLAVLGRIPQDFMTIFTVIIAFYFGTQATKVYKEE